MNVLHQMLFSLTRHWPLIRGRDFMLRNVLRRPTWRDALMQMGDRILTRQGFQMLVNPGNDYISMGLRMFRNIEPETEKFIVKHVPEAGGFADIGANVGYFSLLVANLRLSATVHAFEPNPPVADILEKSIRSNALENRLHLHRLAVGETEGTLPFCIHNTNTGHSRLAADGRSGDIQVPVVIWDRWWSGLSPEPRIHCLKMDIEGAELLALRGMKGFLQKQKPALVVEAYEHQLLEFGCTTNDLRQFIQGLGYHEEPPAHGNLHFIHPQA